MPIIFLCSGVYSNAEKIAEKVSSSTGYKIIRDRELIDEAGKRYKLGKDKIERAVYGKASVFNKFTHDKERATAFLKTILAKYLSEDKRLYFGCLGHLIPEKITHVLKVLVIAEMPARVQQAVKKDGLSEKDAAKLIHKKDESAFLWTQYLFKKDCWDSSLYDIVVPSGKIDADEAAGLIMENLEKGVLQPDTASKKAVRDFATAAEVEMALARKGHDIQVAADDGRISLTINKSVLMLSRLEEELKKTVAGMPGVKDVKTSVGKDFYQTDIYRRYDFNTPSRVLLVDDEKQFVQTLSERLLMREVGSHVVCDGREALDFVQQEEPEVMVLDLKMPGIDGIEVLRRVKETNPAVEVIILTGQGSKKDYDICMELGAFAYLEKPVDMELLTKTMNDAHAKIRSKREA